MEISRELIALWGAGLSSLLALVKAWELWSSRRKIEVSCYFDGRSDVGNDIIIRNISDKPMIITYWELSFRKKKRFKWIPYREEGPNEDVRDICVAGHSSYNFNFSGEYYFDWGYKAFEGKRLYFILHIAGKNKPFNYLVHKG